MILRIARENLNDAVFEVPAQRAGGGALKLRSADSRGLKQCHGTAPS
jgi:hypothetical protein